MSTLEKKNISSVFEMISAIQKFLFYIILFVIPWFIIPLPYDSTEKMKGILFVFLASLLILLEVIKWIWDGKVSVIRSSLDKAFLLLFGSFLISTLFARDQWISLWGFDGRMGTGFLVISILFVFFFLARGFLREKKELIRSLEILLGGIGFLILLSFLSVLKVELFSWIPFVGEFFAVGLPLSFSFLEIMLVTGVGIFLSLLLLVEHMKAKRFQSAIFPILVMGISLVALPIFSVSHGALIPVLILVVMLVVCLFLWIYLEKSLKVLPVGFFVLSALALLFSIGFQYDSFRDSVLGKSFDTIVPITLGTDISWTVSSSSIVDDFFRGVVGLGNDSFAIAYNRYKPVTEGIIALGNTSFIVGSNEIFTILANRGLIGIIVWILLGIVFIRTLVKEFSSTKDEKVTSFLLGIIAFYVFLGSAFVPFSFLLYFLLVILTLLFVLYTNREKKSDEFLLKFWAVNVGDMTKDMNKTMEGINWFLTVLVTLIVTIGLISLLVKNASDAYIVRAEAYNIEQAREYEQYEGDISLEEREAYLHRLAGYYDKALRYNRRSPFINRKSSLIAIEIISLLSEKHSDATKEEQEALLTEVSLWRNIAIDLSKEAISTSNFLYSNWNTRASVYLELTNLGLGDYAEDALIALQNCINLVPLDYDSYYKAGRIFMIQEKYDKALNAFNSVLNVNGQHVPSLVLAARVLQEKGDIENAVGYLQAAKQVLEVNELDIGDIYQGIVDSIEELGGDNDMKDLEEIEELKKEVVEEDFTPLPLDEEDLFE